MNHENASIHRESEPILVETRLRSGKIIRPEEDLGSESEPEDEDSEPEIPPQIPLIPAQPPIHIDPSTLVTGLLVWHLCKIPSHGIVHIT